MNIDSFFSLFERNLESITKSVSYVDFYIQFGLIISSIIIAKFIIHITKNKPKSADKRGLLFKKKILFYGFIIILFHISTLLGAEFKLDVWLIQIAKFIALILALYFVINYSTTNQLVRKLIIWFIAPIAILQAFGFLSYVTNYLDSLVIGIGSIKLSVYDFGKFLFFGLILFWLGRISNNFGQKVIRKQEYLNTQTKEIFAKLFQVALVVVIFILLLQLMGINLTALAVFGGALGVGLGFGLQSIASNFISGIIILLDHSLTVGDFIELEDSKKGTISELNMRSITLETFDGKNIIVPNEKFITSNFINWTHKNKKQRYSIELQVAYNTDLHKLFDILREVVAKHPKVISGENVSIEERPDAEIAGFGDSGVDILIEFWMDGVDDGKNRVGADLLLMIWDAFKENNIEIPFPQREINILNHKNNEL